MWIQSYRYSGSSCLVRAGVWSTFGGGGYDSNVWIFLYYPVRGNFNLMKSYALEYTSI